MLNILVSIGNDTMKCELFVLFYYLNNQKLDLKYNKEFNSNNTYHVRNENNSYNYYKASQSEMLIICKSDMN